MGSELCSAITIPTQLTRLSLATIDRYLARVEGGPRFSSIRPPTVGSLGRFSSIPPRRDQPIALNRGTLNFSIVHLIGLPPAEAALLG